MRQQRRCSCRRRRYRSRVNREGSRVAAGGVTCIAREAGIGRGCARVGVVGVAHRQRTGSSHLRLSPSPCKVSAPCRYRQRLQGSVTDTVEDACVILQAPLTGVMAKFVNVPPLTVGVTVPEPIAGPTEAGLFAQLRPTV